MSRWVKWQRGGVSIFLTILLVPMIVVCSLYIDVSRIQLAKSVASSSADLALNTVLSQYDIDLEQYYGLMGSVQNIEDLYDPAQKSFVLSMQSTEVTPTYLQQKIKDITKLFGKSKKYDDLISIDSDKTSATIENATNANLANPGMMRQQVTEFMKYRGPIDLVSSELDTHKYSNMLGKVEKVGERAKEMPLESNILKAKEAFFQAKSDLLKEALKVFEILRKYEKLQIDADYMEKTKNSLKKTAESDTDISDEFKILHLDYLEYWTHVDKLWSADFKSAESYSNETHGDFSGSDLSASDIAEYITALETAMENYNTALSTINEKLNGITHCEENYLDMSDVIHARYWVQLEQDLSESDYNTFIDSLKEFKKAKENLDSAFDARYIAPEDVPDEDVDYRDVGDTPYRDGTIKSVVSSVSTNAGNLLAKLGNEKVGKVSKNAESYFNETKERVKRDYADTEIKSVVQHTEKDADYGDDPGADKYKEIYERLFDAKEIVGEETWAYDKDVSHYSEDNLRCKVAGLHKLIQVYHEKYGDWEKAVEDGEKGGLDPNTNAVLRDSKNDLLKYNYTDKVSGSGSPTLDEDTQIDLDTPDCETYVNYLVRVADLLISYLDTMEQITYHGKEIIGNTLTSKNSLSVSGINNLENFDKAATGCGNADKQVNIDEIPVSTTKFNEYTENTWEFNNDAVDTIKALDRTFNLDSEGYATNEGLNSPCSASSDNYPIKKDNCDIKIPKFLHWQFEKMEDVENPSDEVDSFWEYVKQLFEDGLGDFAKYDNIHRVDANEIKDQSNLPSKDAGAAADEDKMVDGGTKGSTDSTDQMNGIANMATWLSGISNMYEGIRDDLFATDYIMGMFSYDTHFMETVYDHRALASTQSADNIYKVKDWSNTIKYIKPGNAKDIFDNEKATEYMKSTKTTDCYNKSLTNKVIGPMSDDKGVGYNWAYGNEVEYILSGNSNEKNRERVDEILYFTRLAFNMAPVYTEYWTKHWVMEIASAVATATCGVIPVPLTQFIICSAILALESYVDEQYLLAGLPVKLIKDAKTELFIKLGVNASELKTAVESKSPKEGIFAAGEPNVKGDEFVFSYSDYLSLAVLLETAAVKDNLYLRTSDVIQVNQNKNKDVKQYGENGFKMSKALTYYTIDTEVKVKPMMVALPYGSSYGMDSLLETDTWNTFKYKIVEGY